MSIACDERRSQPDQRTELNLLGKVDTASGESRRNENVRFNLIDNSALKELNIRLGTSATIVEEFRPERSYFGVEFGNAPAAALHGSAYETHNNSVFSARSFFQAGAVLPARQNDYGFDFGAPLWKAGFVSLNAQPAEDSRQRQREHSNSATEERTPLTTDPATRRIVERFIGRLDTTTKSHSGRLP